MSVEGSVGRCHAVDLIAFGENASPDPTNVGILVMLELHVADDGLVSIDITGGRSDFRFLVNEDKLQTALREAGAVWVAKPRAQDG